MVLSEQLRGAIENGEIQAYFQPLVRARDMRVVGFETLGRWFHPEFGAIPPPEFVRLAEENGLITPLTDVIMRQAIEAAKQWPERRARVGQRLAAADQQRAGRSGARHHQGERARPDSASSSKSPRTS